MDIKRVEELAARGLTLAQIADCLGISPTTLYKAKDANTEFLEALKKGQARGIEQVANALFEGAIKGDRVSQIFYLKCRAGWKEAEAALPTGAENDQGEESKLVIDLGEDEAPKADQES